MIPQGPEHIGECMRRRLLDLKNTALRHLAVTGLVTALALVNGAGGAFAQSGTPNPPDQAKQQPGQADANANAVREANQRKVEEFVEAQQAINGPAGNPECVWLGRRVVRLMWNDDLDTAFRHLDLYDRFGCPGGHVQAAFRCLTRFGAQIDDKVRGSLDGRIHACWVNPGAQPQAAAAAAAPTPAPPTAGNAAPAPAASPSPAPTPSATPAPASK
jgi:hypothetical protein